MSEEHIETDGEANSPANPSDEGKERKKKWIKLGAEIAVMLVVGYLVITPLALFARNFLL